MSLDERFATEEIEDMLGELNNVLLTPDWRLNRAEMFELIGFLSDMI